MADGSWAEPAPPLPDAAPETPAASPTAPMGQAFLNLAYAGRPDGWLYILSAPAILFVWQISGVAVLFLVLGGPGFMRLAELILGGENPTGLTVREFVAFNLSAVTLIGAVLAALGVFHQRGPLTLISPRRFSFSRLLQGLGVWFLLYALAAFAPGLFTRQQLQYQPDLARLLPFAVAALLLTPLQVAGEELAFRGYLLQGLGHLTRRPYLLCALSGFLFMLPHLANPEMRYGALPMALSYGGIGFFLALITLRDNRLELALGAHIGNNLFCGLVAHSEVSALPTPALFFASDLRPWEDLLGLIVVGLIFYLIFFLRPRPAPEAGTAPPAGELH